LKKKLILTDIDGVVLDWLSGFITFLEKKGVKVKPDVEQMMWNLSEWIECDNVDALVLEFNSSEGFKTLMPYEDAEWFMPKLANLYEFVAITSCSDTEEAINSRKTNLYSVFGNFFKEIHCLPLQADKTPYLEKYKDAIWIEDVHINAVKGQRAGHETFLITRPWNKDHEWPEIYRVNGWAEIYETLIMR